MHTASVQSASQLQVIRAPISIGFISRDLHLQPLGAIEQLRKKVRRCIPRRQIRPFLEVTFQALKELENFPPDHRLHVNNLSTHFWTKTSSPTSCLFQEIMTKVFHKSCDFSSDCESNLENNSSGFAIQGLGVQQKTQLLRLCTILAPLLLDNVVSAYVNLTSFPNLLPSTLLHQAFSLRTEPKYRQVVSHCQEMNDLSCLLGHASRQDIVTMFALDELLREVYQNQEIWAQLQQLTTHSATTFLVADSTSRLHSLVKSDSDFNATELTKKWYNITRESLNDTKLALITLPP